LRTEGTERGRVIEGKIRFHQGDQSKVLGPGDTWQVEPGTTQGPHIFLAPSRVAVLRDGPGPFDPR